MAEKAVEKHQSTTDDAMFFPSLQREMNRLFDQFRAGFPVADNLPSAVFGAGGFPAIDVVDTGDALEVSAELPGVKEDDLNVSISGDLLTIKGEKSHEHEKKDDSYHRIERRYGSFRRQIPLGFLPESGAVNADFKDGILTLKIAKPAAVKSEVQQIGINKG